MVRLHPGELVARHGGAGKSTLAERLAVDLGLDEDQVVATDAFYAVSCGPEAGMWEQHDWPLLEALVSSVRATPAPERLRYDYRWWSGRTGVEDHPMPAALILEGIRLFSDRTRDWFDLAVWIDLDADTAGEQAKARKRPAGRRPGRAGPLGHQVDPRGSRLRARRAAARAGRRRPQRTDVTGSAPTRDRNDR